MADYEYNKTLTAEDVARMLRVNVRTVHRMDNNEDMPRPLNLNMRGKRWLRADIEEWIRDMGKTIGT